MKIAIKIMKKLIYLLILALSSFSTVAQENVLYVIIDSKYQSIYRFKTEINQSSYYSSIKILKEKYIQDGFNDKSSSKRSNDDIVIVKAQPMNKNYYEFQSYRKPKIVSNIDIYKKYNIKDVSGNIGAFKRIWGNYKYSIIFIEKKKCKYLLWRMKPVYLE